MPPIPTPDAAAAASSKISRHGGPVLDQTAMAPPHIRRRTRPKGSGSSNYLEPKIGNRPELMLAIEYLPINAVKPAPIALRKHPERQLAAIRGSIRVFGLTAPVVIDADNILIDGHAVLEAARGLGYQVIPVLRLEHLSPAERRAYRIAVNKLSEQSNWDEDALRIEIIELVPILIKNEIALEAIGMSTTAIDMYMAKTAEPDDGVDEVEPPNLFAVSRLGDQWELEEHRLICGDCLKTQTLDAVMRGDKARMVFTDPPYNLPVDGVISGLGKTKHREFAVASGEMNEAEFIAFLTCYIANTIPYCVDGAIQFHAMDGKHVHQLIMSVMAAGATYKQLCVWNKSNAGMGTFYRSKHELFVVAKVGSAPHLNNFGLGDSGRYRTNVWDYTGANSFRRGRDEDLAAHPTVKPTALVADAILDVSRPGDVVLDPFCGSGTTILAAELTQRRARGIEIDPIYVDVAIARWQKRTGKAAILFGDGRSFAEIAAERLQISEVANG